jgi:TPR repeat protein
MYEGGYGVPQDFAMAHMWYNLAASRPSPGDDHLFRDEAVKFRDEIAAKMTPAQIAEAQRMAREWAPK